ncbi:methyltransferase family protein [Branchiibius hedensis]|uniref:Methyltransferase domain-containing protein n=1 Tax=Branchiibius hedensis TaxID=672460 RepID=A0A2Y8ZUH3_9MICO|nr:methyltransferase domain-containing protein [Branchiibius hedensis]PWJ26764.1 methyltransferase family protein [Branchiibius hedensis]SSA35575.1 Methyltransferase domain-containing protein [Branchiibius hedensis]
MTFEVAADAYQAFMGRYADPLADQLLAFLVPTPGQRALDVGAGSGAVVHRLADLLGADAVAAVDPSPPFVAALRERLPDTDVRLASAESLPFADGDFDLVIAQLVVQFMTDADGGIAQMCRVTRPGGRVAASVWDFGGGRSPLSIFWQAANELFDNVPDESGQLGTSAGELASLLRHAGLNSVIDTELAVDLSFDSFESWWQPYELGVGPAGAYLLTLDPAQRESLRRRCAQLLPTSPGPHHVVAWLAVGTRD